MPHRNSAGSDCYWARMLDLYLFSVVIGLWQVIYAPRTVPHGLAGKILFAMVTLALWVFAESLLLYSFGTTPGKSLLNPHKTWNQ